ncbi:MAG: hypothetical protein IJW36_00420 [Clostridia bacterium]|nr:hypothetical protein [Clostridia bacterium]
MVKKKKISGQTLAIIILAVLLLLTIGFGGVFAYYSARSNKVSGKIVMANLKISLESGAGNTGESDKSEIVISNGVNVVPGQPLENTALVIRNLSSTDIYLAVVYEINATRQDKTVIEDDFVDPVLGLGVEYINSTNTEANDTTGVSNQTWIDFVFNGEQEGKLYRCLVSMVSFSPTAETENGIVVIGENKLSLAGSMGNEYQNTSISFTFQAYAIGAGSFTDEFAKNPTKAEKCQSIVSKIYESQSYTFLNVSVNN